MNILSINNELNEFNKKLDNSIKCEDLNKEIIDISKNVNSYLNKNLDELFVIREECISESSNLNKKFDEILNKIKDKKTIDQKNFLFNEINKIKKIIEKAIQSKDNDIRKIKKKDRNFYLAYKTFLFDRRLWRDSLSKERINWEEVQRNPLSHPEWPLFLKMMKKLPIDDAVIERIWILVIKGINLQLNTSRIGKNFEEVSEFKELVQILKEYDLLKVKPGELPALWSGGVDLSIYARNSNFVSADTTTAGQIFEHLILYPTFRPKESLWDHLVKGFLENSFEEIHVFFRVHDPFSSLEMIELPDMALKKKKIIFHPIINRANPGDELDFQEVEVQPNENAKIKLKNTLVRMSQDIMQKRSDVNDTDVQKVYSANILAIEIMKID